MRLHPTSLLAGLLLAITSTLAAQKATAAPAKAELDTAALTKLAKLKLGEAIGIAQKARPGIATTAELEAATDAGQAVPCFEVMLLGKDKTVYEVRIHAGTGKVLANAVCTDEEDLGEVKAAAMHQGTSLASIAAEAHALLRGTCLRAELVASKQRAEVTMWNHGRKIQAEFGLDDGSLLAVKAAAPGKAQDDDGDDERNEANEGKGEEHEGDESDEQRRPGKPTEQPQRKRGGD